MKRQNKYFLLQCVAGLALLGAGYFFSVEKILIPDHQVPKSFRQFIFQASVGIPNRIIVESGSNSIYAIDVGMVEQATGRASFNIADVAGYPLQHKIYRLSHYLNAGDVVILPIEWLQYSDTSQLNAAYVKSLVDEQAANSFYYHALPLLRRLEFTFLHLPYNLALNGILFNSWNSLGGGNGRQSQGRDLQLIKARLDTGSRGSSTDNKDMPLETLTRGMRCKAFLFGVGEERLTISDQFIENLVLLQQVQKETGARVIFAWPTVVAKDENSCYEKLTADLELHAANVKEIINSYGFEFIGHFKDSEYPAECMRDTYYHIKHKCAVKRTRLLIEQLAELGLSGKSGMNTKQVNDAMLDEWRHLYDQVHARPEGTQ